MCSEKKDVDHHEYSDDKFKSLFVAEMNKKAHALGMLQSHFFNACGFGTRNTTTAKDMLLLLLEAYKYRDIQNVWSEKEKTITVNMRQVGYRVLFTNFLKPSKTVPPNS